jgi:hypothetical protein
MNTSVRNFCGCFLATSVIVGASCSHGNALGTVPVGGKITYNGKPVEGAIVTFVGEGDVRTATGKTMTDGTYQLMTLDSLGAMPGTYSVLVDKAEVLPAPKAESMEEAARNANKPLPKPKKLLPAKYGDAGKTPFNIEVKRGAKNNIDLQLAD